MLHNYRELPRHMQQLCRADLCVGRTICMPLFTPLDTLLGHSPCCSVLFDKRPLCVQTEVSTAPQCKCDQGISQQQERMWLDPQYLWVLGSQHPNLLSVRTALPAVLRLIYDTWPVPVGHLQQVRSLPSPVQPTVRWLCRAICRSATVLTR